MSVIPELPGLRLRYARRAAGYTQAELSRIISMPPWWMSETEHSPDLTGYRLSPPVRQKLAEVLHIDPQTLLHTPGVVVLSDEERGDRLRAARHYRGLSMHRTGVYVGRSGNWIRDVESGELILSGKMRHKLAEALDMDPDTFLIAGELNTCGCGCGARIAPGVRCPNRRSQNRREWAINAGHRSNRNRTLAAGKERAEQLLKLGAESWLDYLPPHHAEALRLAIKHPDLSIAELGALTDPPSSKDIMSGRLRRAQLLLTKLGE